MSTRHLAISTSSHDTVLMVFYSELPPSLAETVASVYGWLKAASRDNGLVMVISDSQRLRDAHRRLLEYGESVLQMAMVESER